MRYLEIADALRDLLSSDELGPGGALPSEADLATRFSASRVTVRRALDELRREGLVTARQGSGWFSSVDPVRQALGRFTTVEAALEAAGITAGREVLEFAFEAVDAPIATALDLSPGDEVLRVLRRNLAGDDPFGLVTVWVRADLGATLSRRDAEGATFYELLAARGIALGTATQTITADLADERDAQHLRVAPGAPMLVCHRTTRDAAGRPVLCSEHRYPAHATAFEVELPRVTASGEGVVGLHLVSGRNRGPGGSDPAATTYAEPRSRQGARHG